ncbi:DUF2515 family protein [Sutcliffiella deserti]|uniref:DUF2515 family protein n=1 Tax=Sutcliffiella deserti TaxID=2875501 RepID=UPI001CC17A21|nr:DUF2515 family protein [Sutcliffiella deserti]
MFFNWFGSKYSKTEEKHQEQIKVLSSNDADYLLRSWLSPTHKVSLSHKEKEILLDISNKTISHNKNNLTRTQAYLNLYGNNPELHWSYLAHMVSRNAGWNMTDLKGKSISKLLSYDRLEVFFSFLEKANYVIFNDAFPQLLIYEKGKIESKDYTYLLPHLGVSDFMLPVWRLFMEQKVKNSPFLTVSLIINEQNLLETQVMLNPFYQKKVVQSLTFHLQEMMGFTQILFPYVDGESLQLTGSTIAQFDEVASRIKVGKKLYRLLFGNKDVHEGALSFAKSNIHTGSREDYFPSVFSASKNTKKIFSPNLEDAWPTYKHKPAKKLQDDWFNPSASRIFLDFYRLPFREQITDMKKPHIYNVIQVSGLSELQSLIPEIEKRRE